MRYVFAISALVLSGVLLLLGIGQRTFLAGPAEISYQASGAGSAAYAVIPAEELNAEPGQANVVVSGTDAFVAVGATRDVEAWVAPFDRELLTAGSGNELVATVLPGDPEISYASDEGESEGAQADPVNPRGSDLWLEERSTNPGQNGDTEASEEDSTGQQTVRMPVSLSSGQSVLIATDGEAPVSEDISVSWMQDRNTPLAGPLLAGGALFALVGGILYLLAFDHDRRGLGPRRGRKGPLQGIRNMFGGSRKRNLQRTSLQRTGVRASVRRSSKIFVPALGLGLALGLSSCSAGYWPDFSQAEVEATAEPEADENAAPVPVTEGQIDRILTRVAEAAAVGDENLDVDELSARFTGDALAQREANYKIRKSVPDYEIVPPTITDEALGYELVQSTEGWPRTLFVTVASTSETGSDDTGDEENGEDAPADDSAAEESAQNSPSLALILRQDSPFENFLVSRVISLRGGIAMPPAAPVSEGTALLPDDLQSLALEPRRVGETYAKILVNGTEEEDAKLFDLTDDVLLEKSGSAWVRQAQKAADDEDQKVTYSVVAEQGGEPTVSLSTGTDGALVAATVIEERTEAGEDNWKPTAVGSVSALSGLEGSHPKLVRQLAHQMLFFVPSEDSGEKIQILGATSELVGARK
ncbi:glycosyltransferase [Leucobacter sp. GX24907]